MRSKQTPLFSGKVRRLELNLTHSASPENNKNHKKSYYYIYNCKRNNIEYMSHNILDVLGYTVEEFDMDSFILSIHPDDLAYRNQCEYNLVQLRESIATSTLFKYAISYSFRLKTKAGNYVTIKQEYQTIETDEYGNMYKNFVYHEVIADYQIRPEFDFLIIDKEKSKTISFNAEFNLTKREVEILTLINEGYQSKEISEMLNISTHTTKTHRKNILYKTESSSLIEVLKKVGM